MIEAVVPSRVEALAEERIVKVVKLYMLMENYKDDYYSYSLMVH